MILNNNTKYKTTGNYKVTLDIKKNVKVVESYKTVTIPIQKATFFDNNVRALKWIFHIQANG